MRPPHVMLLIGKMPDGYADADADLSMLLQICSLYNDAHAAQFKSATASSSQWASDAQVQHGERSLERVPHALP